MLMANNAKMVESLAANYKTCAKEERLMVKRKTAVTQRVEAGPLTWASQSELEEALW